MCHHHIQPCQQCRAWRIYRCALRSEKETNDFSTLFVCIELIFRQERLNAIARECIIKSHTKSGSESERERKGNRQTQRQFAYKHPNRFANRHTNTHACIAYSYYLHAITSLSGLIRHINTQANRHTHTQDLSVYISLPQECWVARWWGFRYVVMSFRRMVEIWSAFRVHALSHTDTSTQPSAIREIVFEKSAPETEATW